MQQQPVPQLLQHILCFMHQTEAKTVSLFRGASSLFLYNPSFILIVLGTYHRSKALLSRKHRSKNGEKVRITYSFQLSFSWLRGPKWHVLYSFSTRQQSLTQKCFFQISAHSQIQRQDGTTYLKHDSCPQCYPLYQLLFLLHFSCITHGS